MSAGARTGMMAWAGPSRPMRWDPTQSSSSNKGRGLETLTYRMEGDIVCGASALFWDEWDDLLTWAKLPGNARFCHRIVQIDKVKRMGQDITIWVVSVGVVPFAQHYDGYRPRANCVLEFDPSKGVKNR